MLRWYVADVDSFFEAKDAVSIGKSLGANSVQGAHLLRFTVESLKKDLNFNAFVAEKICILRDEFLA